MNKDDIKKLVQKELRNLNSLDNWHGISRNNINKHLVDPYLIVVFASEDGSDPTDMWIVLHEHTNEPFGYLVGYCPPQKEWCLVEKALSERFVCNIAGDKTLIEALNNM